MRIPVVIFLAALLAAPGSYAADIAPAGTLAPGKPAGLKQAQLDRTTVLEVAGGVVLVVGFAVLLAKGDGTNAPLQLSSGNNVLGVTGTNVPNIATTSTK